MNLICESSSNTKHWKVIFYRARYVSLVLLPKCTLAHCSFICFITHILLWRLLLMNLAISASYASEVPLIYAALLACLCHMNPTLRVYLLFTCTIDTNSEIVAWGAVSSSTSIHSANIAGNQYYSSIMTDVQKAGSCQLCRLTIRCGSWYL